MVSVSPVDWYLRDVRSLIPDETSGIYRKSGVSNTEPSSLVFTRRTVLPYQRTPSNVRISSENPTERIQRIFGNYWKFSVLCPKPFFWISVLTRCSVPPETLDVWPVPDVLQSLPYWILHYTYASTCNNERMSGDSIGRPVFCHQMPSDVRYYNGCPIVSQLKLFQWPHLAWTKIPLYHFGRGLAAPIKRS